MGCKSVLVLFLSAIFSQSSYGAIPSKYQVSMRIDMKGQLPLSISTPVKTGRKASFTDISPDGKSETLVELISKKSHIGEKEGLWMDVKVTRTVAGLKKAVEQTQIFAIDNQEAEMSKGGVRGKNPDFALAVMAHSI